MMSDEEELKRWEKLEEEERKKGRPTNAERWGKLSRERSASYGKVDDLWKRKREDPEDEEAQRKKERKRLEEELKAFSSSKRSNRSPDKGKEENKDGKKGREGEVEREGEGKKEGEGEEIEEKSKEESTMMEKMREEIRVGLEEVKGQHKEVRKEVENLMEELKRREEKWDKERKELHKEVRELRKKIEDLEKRKDEPEGLKYLENKVKELEVDRREGEGEKEGGSQVMERLKVAERRIEMKEREEKRENIVIKGIKIKDGNRKESVKEILRAIGVEAEIKEVWSVGGSELGERGGKIVAKLGSKEQKREVMLRKKALRGREERVEDDLTWAERRMKWNLEEIARKEEWKGRRTSISYGKIWIDGENIISNKNTIKYYLYTTFS